MLKYRIGAAPRFQLDAAPQFIFSVGRINEAGTVTALGTAFCLDKSRLFATAAHVVGQTDEGLVILLNSTSDIQDYQLGVRGKIQCIPVKIQQYNPVHDLAILKLDSPQDVKWDIKVGSADSVGVGTDVITLGYPHLDVGRFVLTRHHAAVGAKIFLPLLGNNIKFLVLNFLARPGQSGSPVFRPGSQEIVGVLTGAYRPESGQQILIDGVDAAAINQTTHAVSAEYLKGMY